MVDGDILYVVYTGRKDVIRIISARRAAKHEQKTWFQLAPEQAAPMKQSVIERMKRTPQAKIIRRALGVTQEEFAARYHIPLGTLRDWEQGRATPDQPTRAYVTAIARDHDGVQKALQTFQ